MMGNIVIFHVLHSESIMDDLEKRFPFDFIIMESSVGFTFFEEI